MFRGSEDLVCRVISQETLVEFTYSPNKGSYDPHL